MTRMIVVNYLTWVAGMTEMIRMTGINRMSLG